MHPLQAKLQSSKPVIALFTSSRNAAGRQMVPVLHEVEQLAGGRASVLTIDIDTDNHLAGLYNIQTVPTVALFKQGELIWKRSGLAPAHEILEHLSLHIA